MCDTMVHVRPDGVLFAKNSDRDPNEAQVLDWQPARDHEAGELKCTWIAIPQVAHTHAVLLSRPFWHWGAEMGTNEHGVVIGNEAVFTNQRYAKTGLTGMDLLRLALERASTAEEAVGVLVDLLEKHGQGGGCGHENRRFTYHSSFLVADRGGAFVLETAGKKWATEKVEQGARSISNGLTIRGFTKHGDMLRSRVAACRTRRARTEKAAAEATGPLDLFRALRDHGPSEYPSYRWLNGAMAAPCMHAGGIVSASQTTASWVSELGDETRHWATATAAPCTSIFKPVSLSEPLDLGVATDRVDDHSLWWRHERFHRAVARDPDATFPKFTAERDRLEADMFHERATSRDAFARADAATADWLERMGTPDDRRPWYVHYYWEDRDERSHVPDPNANTAPEG